MLKRALLGVSVAALLVGSASAADLSTRYPAYPVKAAPVVVPTFSWTGFYVGGNVGWGWASNSFDYTPFGGLAYNYDLGNANGFLGGIQAGYNYQFVNNVVLGAEADLEFADISTNGTPVFGPLSGYGTSAKVDTFGTIRARAGYAFDRFLPYITGGAAWANSKSTIGLTENKDTNWGWTIGGGAEYALTNNWTVKAEYLYLNFDGNTYTYPDFSSLKTGYDLQTAKVGVNYKF